MGDARVSDESVPGMVKDYGSAVPRFGAYMRSERDGRGQKRFHKASALIGRALRHIQEVDTEEADLMIRVIEQALEDLLCPRHDRLQRNRADAVDFFSREDRYGPYCYAAGIEPGYLWRLLRALLPPEELQRVFTQAPTPANQPVTA